MARVRELDNTRNQLPNMDATEPQFMYLGCADSRVSEGTIFDADPGTLFTHRNIANVFVPQDASS